MANLDLESAHEYWKNYEDPMIYRVVSFMEAVEKWTLDGNPELEAAMIKLSAELSKLDGFELGQEDQLIHFSCHIKMTRLLRLLQAFDTIDPGSASKLLMYAEEHSGPNNRWAEIFLRRNIVFERLRLLSRVFSKKRLDIVMGALEKEDV